MTNLADRPRSRPPVRQPVLLGLFTGTAVGVGYLLSGVPNVELMTLVVALCGGVLGAGAGFAAGVVAAVIYSLGSPLGLPVPLLLGAQALGLAGAGVGGAWGGNRMLASHFKGQRLRALGWAGLTGLGGTFIYDLLTNLSIIGAFGARPDVVLVGAVPFFLLHAASNLVIFTALLPLLLPRLKGLGQASLVGRDGAAILLAVVLVSGTAAARAAEPDPAPAAAPVAAPPDTAATAAFDSTATARGRRLEIPPGTLDPDSGPARAFGWRRPLWTPFARTSLEWLAWYSPRVPVIDGGLGASAVVLGEAGTHWNPTFLRDGIPVGTGHILADDPWLTATEGLVVSDLAEGADGWGGTGGVVGTTTADEDPAKATSSYRGVKGRHESYFRGVHLLTPQAAWRAAFEFEESLDVESYDFTGGVDAAGVASGGTFPGHSRVRQSRTRLFRELGGGDRLVVEYGNGRLTKDALPALGAEHLELWDDNIAATMVAGLGAWRLTGRAFWRNRDVAWGDRSATAVVGQDLRLLETAREGLAVDLVRTGGTGAGPRTGLELRAVGWRIDDSLSAETWLDGYAGTVDGDGQSARGVVRTGTDVGPGVLDLAAGLDWDSHAGGAPTGRVALAAAGPEPWLSLAASYGGRAPRSDELLTPLQRNVAGRRLELLPNRDLAREQTLRVGVGLRFDLLGFDLAVDASARRLRDGITWQSLPGETDRGAWTNGLAMDSRRVTGSLGRQGRFLGWGRATVEGTWQETDEITGRATWLPPARSLRSVLNWENHFFLEDGILQLALLSTMRGEMGDPWDVTRTARLPVRTVHDLLIGFRLVGAHLSVGIRNLTGERIRLTSGAVSTGQELDLRLHWAWVY